MTLRNVQECGRKKRRIRKRKRNLSILAAFSVICEAMVNATSLRPAIQVGWRPAGCWFPTEWRYVVFLELLKSPSLCHHVQCHPLQ